MDVLVHTHKYGVYMACIGTTSVLAALYLRLVRNITQPGIVRLLASIPVLCFCIVAPLGLRYPEEVVSRAVVAFSLSWVLAFKTLAMAMNRGALADATLTTVQFCAFAVLPLSPGSPAKKTRSPLQLLLRFYAKIILLALVVHALTHWELHPLAKTVSYGTGLYFFLGVLMDGPGTLLTWVLGVPLAPHFNNPFGATSLGDLWGRRWNLTAGGSLRRLLYDPMVEGVLVKQRGLAPARRVWMRAPAALLSFVVSGVMHEVLWWYITGATTPNLAWFWFFTVHGLACVVEEVVRVVLRRNGVLLENRVLGWVWTMGFFIATGHLLFVPPPERAGVAAMVVKSLRVMYDALSRALLVLYVTPVAPT